MAREDRRPGGLGRPLDAIIAGARPAPSRWTGAPERPPELEPVMAAGLDALGTALKLDLAGYLHRGPDRGSHLVVRLAIPSAEPEPDAAFELLHLAAAALDADVAPLGEVRALGLDILTVVTAGSRSRGVHLLGRREAPLDGAEAELAHRLCAALAAACHTLEDAWSAATAWSAGAERTAS